MKRSRKISAGAAAAVLLVWAAWRASDSPVVDAEVAGNEIISALERYNADHGEFPARLNLLIPNYMQALPHTNRVNQWLYTGDAANFDLGFHISETEYYFFDTQTHDWKRDES